MNIRRLWQHEKALTGLAVILWLALVWRAGFTSRVTLTVLGVAVFQLIVSQILPPRWRLVGAYLAVLALFKLTRDVVPALGLPTHDASLLAVDRALFGETPSVALDRFVRPWATEVMSAFYLSYLVYFHVGVVWALVQPLDKALRYFEPVLTALVIGMCGYYLVPALGPGPAFPHLFGAVFQGGPLTRLNSALVSGGSGVYDVFPSLHVMMTCVLLAHDRREHPLRYRVMLPIAAGLFLSTVYLRYHYGIDLVAGVVWFVAIQAVRYAREPVVGLTAPTASR